MFIILGRTYSQDFSYYYNPFLDILFFSDFSLNSNIHPYLSINSDPFLLITRQEVGIEPSKILGSSNKYKDYKYSHINGTLHFQYYKINLYNTPYTLIKSELYKKNRKIYHEIFLDSYDIKEKTKIFPNNFKNSFIVKESKTVIRDVYETNNKRIYNTFGFDMINLSSYDYVINKILLVSYDNKKAYYLNDITSLLEITYENEFENTTKISYNFYMKNLPEKFTLYINLDLINRTNSHLTGDRALIIYKDIHYPHFKIENENPNKNIFIIGFLFIGILFILTIIFSCIKIRGN